MNEFEFFMIKDHLGLYVTALGWSGGYDHQIAYFDPVSEEWEFHIEPRRDKDNEKSHELVQDLAAWLTESTNSQAGSCLEDLIRKCL